MARAKVEFGQRFVRVQTISHGIVDPKAGCDLLSGDATVQEIGASIRRALDASRNFMPDEERRPLMKDGQLAQYVASIDVKTMEAFGFKKKRDIYHGIGACLVSEDGGLINFRTMLHVGMGSYKGKAKGSIPISPVNSTSEEEVIGSAAKTAAFDI